MPLSRDEKSELIREFGESENDVGSPEVQITLLSKRIEQLSSHMEKAPKDNHSSKGLVALVAKRRRLLNYMKRAKPEKYNELIKRIGLRK